MCSLVLRPKEMCLVNYQHELSASEMRFDPRLELGRCLLASGETERSRDLLKESGSMRDSGECYKPNFSNVRAAVMLCLKRFSRSGNSLDDNHAPSRARMFEKFMHFAAD